LGIEFSNPAHKNSQKSSSQSEYPKQSFIINKLQVLARFHT
jgi:hypothetical protein